MVHGKWNDMNINFEVATVFFAPNGEQFVELVQLAENQVIAAKVSDVGGGGAHIPVFLVEKPA
jgi:hypothetical protein